MHIASDGAAMEESPSLYVTCMWQAVNQSMALKESNKMNTYMYLLVLITGITEEENPVLVCGGALQGSPELTGVLGALLKVTTA